MKKISLLLATLLASTFLASCGTNEEDESTDDEETTYPITFETEGGSKDEQTALLEAVNKTICTKTGSASILPKKSPTLEEDVGDYIKVTTVQNVKYNKKSYTVELEWEPDTESAFYETTEHADNEHDIFYIKYPGYQKAGGEFKWTLASATCGEAHSKGEKIVDYKAKVVGATLLSEEKSIGFITAVTNSQKVVTAGDKTYTYPSTFDLVDYEYTDGEKYNPYFKINEGSDPETQKYFYVKVPARVVYLAPDGNWGLIADGKDFLEIYAGAGTPLKTANYPYLRVGDDVVIHGNVSQYCGNVQLGFITQVTKATDAQKAKIQDPIMDYMPLNDAFFEKIGSTAPQKQAIDEMNGLGTITGTYVAGSLKNSSGGSISPDNMIVGKNRYTFELKDANNNKIVVAYDYHVNPSGEPDNGILTKLKAALKSGSAITIKGTLRYAGRDKGSEDKTGESSPFVLDSSNPGVWNIVPFLADHISY